MVPRTRLFALPLGVAVAVMLSACSDSQNPTEPGSTIADVDEYFLTLPTWDEFAAPVAEAEFVVC